MKRFIFFIGKYYKYGFKFSNIEDDEKVLYNKNILDNLYTKDIPFNNLLYIILKKIIDGKYEEIYFPNGELATIIYSITKLYNKHADDKLYIFLKELTLNYCIIMALTYFNIYDALKLKRFDSDQMILDL